MKNTISSSIVSLICGILFAYGLCFSDMINPARVLAFLDVTGHWDPTLLFVMVGALMITLPGYHFILSKSKPILEKKFHLSQNKNIDHRLIAGAILFGIGWGLIGLCPGPAISGLVLGEHEVWLFVIAMFTGFYSTKLFIRN